MHLPAISYLYSPFNVIYKFIVEYRFTTLVDNHNSPIACNRHGQVAAAFSVACVGNLSSYVVRIVEWSKIL